MLLDAPNVLILDEPTNDLDTDMLTAMEDVLDTFPGTLIVVSHDRYLIERVTDQQYAVVGGRLRHLPGGVDEYLGLEDAESVVVPDAVRTAGLSGAERRDLEKRVASLDRRMQRLDRRDAEGPRRARDARPERLRRPRVDRGPHPRPRAERDTLELEWLEAAERLESA